VAIRSVPVRVYYPPVTEHVSHFRPFLDTVRIIFIVLGLIFRVLVTGRDQGSGIRGQMVNS